MGRNWLGIFDIGDGSGSHASSCHLRGGESGIHGLAASNNISGVIVFKRELADIEDIEGLMKYYPWPPGGMSPIGIPCGDEEHVYSIKRKISKKEIKKDIDVLWIGTLNEENATPPCNELKKENWPFYWRLNGFETLMKIKESRPDLNIVCSKDK